MRKLPYKGHKTITLREEQVTKLEDKYYTNIKKYRAMKLTSFSKFVQWYIDNAMALDPTTGQDNPQS